MLVIRNFPWLPFGWDGMALRPFVFLRRGHEALLNHEKVHLEQQKKYGWRYYWRYVTSKDFRFKMEIEAYTVGSRLTPHQAVNAASRYIEGII